MLHEGLAAGTVVASKYVVERMLGRGGMGAVYVVSHVTTGKRMAMKCLLQEYVQSADLVGRFLREAQVMGRLHHRHVVDVFDVGRDGDVLYIVMELLEGKPLSELLHDSSLTLEEALVILLRAMEGVAAAHDHGVVHRDLKPDNIFICIGSSGRLDDPRVLDFGISKLEDAIGDQLTNTGVTLGTPFYMSVEQLKGERDLDQRVDVYALGVILYEAIAGVPPHVADSVSALAIKVMTTEPVHLAVLRPDLPEGLADVVMKALARDRESRQRSVRALIQALRPFVPGSAGLLVPEGQGRPLRTPRAAATARPAARSSRPPLPRDTGASSASAGPPTRSAAPTLVRDDAKVWLRRVGVALCIVVVALLAALLARRTPDAPSAEVPLPPVLPSRVGAGELGSGVLRRGEGASPSPSPTTTTGEGGDAGLVSRPLAPATLPQREGATVSGTATATMELDAPVRVDAGSAEIAATPTTAKRPVARKPRPGAETMSPSNTPQPVEPLLAPAPGTPVSPKKSAEGRAGKLGSDEF